MASEHVLGAGQWQVSAFLAQAEDAGGRAAVQAVRELRARILFDRGRRPAFAGLGGRFTDDQDLDFRAWHFLARAEPGGSPLGYVRLCTPVATAQFQSRAFLGGTRFEDLLRERGLAVEEVFEHSRLVVEHRARKLGLGLYLNAWAIAAAHHLGAAAMIGTSGTKDGQDLFHEQFGFEAVAGTRRYVPQYTEDVVIMFHRVAGGAGQYTEVVDQLRSRFPDLTVDAAVAAAIDAAATVSPDATASSERADEPASSVPAALARVAGAGGGAAQVWRPVLLNPSDAGDRDGLVELLGSGQVREVHDVLQEQLTELVTSRDPACTDPGEISRRRREQMAGAAAWEYGTWVWYPWSGRLVHVLPREEFRLVRTDRNRGRIERPQQRRLLHRRIGVIGLSVGNSSAVTFALEGIGGAFKLADFDDFGLSNLNRLRAGVHDLGVNKAVICARQMYEIDPYLDIEIHTDGLTADNIGEFFTGGHGPIDLLVEECDTPWVKIAAREYARDLGIPVVMDCNDRGMLDIERFDIEPDRPLLHGRLGDVKSAHMLDLSRAQKVDLILAMVDADRISPELAASFDQLGSTLSSWPQLASGVALGGALTAEAARRILLDQPCPSGRFYTDLEQQLHPDNDTARSMA